MAIISMTSPYIKRNTIKPSTYYATSPIRPYIGMAPIQRSNLYNLQQNVLARAIVSPYSLNDQKVINQIRNEYYVNSGPWYKAAQTIGGIVGGVAGTAWAVTRAANMATIAMGGTLSTVAKGTGIIGKSVAGLKKIANSMNVIKAVKTANSTYKGIKTATEVAALAAGKTLQTGAKVTGTVGKVIPIANIVFGGLDLVTSGISIANSDYNAMTNSERNFAIANQAIGITSGIASTAVGIGMLVAGSNFWNPVGWAAFGISAALGVASAIMTGIELGKAAGTVMTPEGAIAAGILARNLANSAWRRPITTMLQYGTLFGTRVISNKLRLNPFLSDIASMGSLQLTSGLGNILDNALWGELDEESSISYTDFLSMRGDIMDNITGSTRIKAALASMGKDKTAYGKLIAKAYGEHEDGFDPLDFDDTREAWGFDMGPLGNRAINILGEILTDPSNVVQYSESYVKSKASKVIASHIIDDIDKIDTDFLKILTKPKDFLKGLKRKQIEHLIKLKIESPEKVDNYISVLLSNHLKSSTSDADVRNVFTAKALLKEAIDSKFKDIQNFNKSFDDLDEESQEKIYKENPNYIGKWTQKEIDIKTEMDDADSKVINDKNLENDYKEYKAALDDPTKTINSVFKKNLDNIRKIRNKFENNTRFLKQSIKNKYEVPIAKLEAIKAAYPGLKLYKDTILQDAKNNFSASGIQDVNLSLKVLEKNYLNNLIKTSEVLNYQIESFNATMQVLTKVQDYFLVVPAVFKSDMTRKLLNKIANRIQETKDGRAKKYITSEMAKANGIKYKDAKEIVKNIKIKNKLKFLNDNINSISDNDILAFFDVQIRDNKTELMNLYNEIKTKAQELKDLSDLIDLDLQAKEAELKAKGEELKINLLIQKEITKILFETLTVDNIDTYKDQLNKIGISDKDIELYKEFKSAKKVQGNQQNVRTKKDIFNEIQSKYLKLKINYELQKEFRNKFIQDYADSKKELKQENDHILTETKDLKDQIEKDLETAFNYTNRNGKLIVVNKDNIEKLELEVQHLTYEYSNRSKELSAEEKDYVNRLKSAVNSYRFLERIQKQFGNNFQDMNDLVIQLQDYDREMFTEFVNDLSPIFSNRIMKFDSKNNEFYITVETFGSEYIDDEILSNTETKFKTLSKAIVEDTSPDILATFNFPEDSPFRFLIDPDNKGNIKVPVDISNSFFEVLWNQLNKGKTISQSNVNPRFKQYILNKIKSNIGSDYYEIVNDANYKSLNNKIKSIEEKIDSLQNEKKLLKDNSKDKEINLQQKELEKIKKEKNDFVKEKVRMYNDAGFLDYSFFFNMVSDPYDQNKLRESYNLYNDLSKKGSQNRKKFMAIRDSLKNRLNKTDTTSDQNTGVSSYLKFLGDALIEGVISIKEYNILSSEKSIELTIGKNGTLSNFLYRKDNKTNISFSNLRGNAGESVPLKSMPIQKLLDLYIQKYIEAKFQKENTNFLPNIIDKANEIFAEIDKLESIAPTILSEEFFAKVMSLKMPILNSFFWHSVASQYRTYQLRTRTSDPNFENNSEVYSELNRQEVITKVNELNNKETEVDFTQRIENENKENIENFREALKSLKGTAFEGLFKQEGLDKIFELLEKGEFKDLFENPRITSEVEESESNISGNRKKYKVKLSFSDYKVFDIDKDGNPIVRNENLLLEALKRRWKTDGNRSIKVIEDFIRLIESHQTSKGKRSKFLKNLIFSNMKDGNGEVLELNSLKMLIKLIEKARTPIRIDQIFNAFEKILSKFSSMSFELENITEKEYSVVQDQINTLMNNLYKDASAGKDLKLNNNLRLKLLWNNKTFQGLIRDVVNVSKKIQAIEQSGKDGENKNSKSNLEALKELQNNKIAKINDLINEKNTKFDFNKNAFKELEKDKENFFLGKAPSEIKILKAAALSLYEKRLEQDPNFLKKEYTDINGEERLRQDILEIIKLARNGLTIKDIMKTGFNKVSGLFYKIFETKEMDQRIFDLFGEEEKPFIINFFNLRPSGSNIVFTGHTWWVDGKISNALEMYETNWTRQSKTFEESPTEAYASKEEAIQDIGIKSQQDNNAYNLFEGVLSAIEKNSNGVYRVETIYKPVINEKDAFIRIKVINSDYTSNDAIENHSYFINIPIVTSLPKYPELKAFLINGNYYVIKGLVEDIGRKNPGDVTEKFNAINHLLGIAIKNDAEKAGYDKSKKYRGPYALQKRIFELFSSMYINGERLQFSQNVTLFNNKQAIENQFKTSIGLEKSPEYLNKQLENGNIESTEFNSGSFTYVEGGKNNPSIAYRRAMFISQTEKPSKIFAQIVALRQARQMIYNQTDSNQKETGYRQQELIINKEAKGIQSQPFINARIGFSSETIEGASNYDGGFLIARSLLEKITVADSNGELKPLKIGDKLQIGIFKGVISGIIDDDKMPKNENENLELIFNQKDIISKDSRRDVWSLIFNEIALEEYKNNPDNFKPIEFNQKITNDELKKILQEYADKGNKTAQRYVQTLGKIKNKLSLEMLTKVTSNGIEKNIYQGIGQIYVTDISDTHSNAYKLNGYNQDVTEEADFKSQKRIGFRFGSEEVDMFNALGKKKTLALFKSRQLAALGRNSDDEIIEAARRQQFSEEEILEIYERNVYSYELPGTARANILPSGLDTNISGNLKQNEISISRKMANTLALKEGDKVLVERQPLMWKHGFGLMTVKIHDDIDGIFVNPRWANVVQGDFDSDAITVISLKNNNATANDDVDQEIIKELSESFEVTDNIFHPITGKVLNKLDENYNNITGLYTGEETLNFDKDFDEDVFNQNKDTYAVNEKRSKKLIALWKGLTDRFLRTNVYLSEIIDDSDDPKVKEILKRAVKIKGMMDLFYGQVSVDARKHSDYIVGERLETFYNNFQTIFYSAIRKIKTGVGIGNNSLKEKIKTMNQLQSFLEFFIPRNEQELKEYETIFGIDRANIKEAKKEDLIITFFINKNITNKDKILDVLELIKSLNPIEDEVNNQVKNKTLFKQVTQHFENELAKVDENYSKIHNEHKNQFSAFSNLFENIDGETTLGKAMAIFGQEEASNMRSSLEFFEIFQDFIEKNELSVHEIELAKQIFLNNKLFEINSKEESADNDVYDGSAIRQLFNPKTAGDFNFTRTGKDADKLRILSQILTNINDGLNKNINILPMFQNLSLEKAYKIADYIYNLIIRINKGEVGPITVENMRNTMSFNNDQSSLLNDLAQKMIDRIVDFGTANNIDVDQWVENIKQEIGSGVSVSRFVGSINNILSKTTFNPDYLSKIAGEEETLIGANSVSRNGVFVFKNNAKDNLSRYIENIMYKIVNNKSPVFSSISNAIRQMQEKSNLPLMSVMNIENELNKNKNLTIEEYLEILNKNLNATKEDQIDKIIPANDLYVKHMYLVNLFFSKFDPNYKPITIGEFVSALNTLQNRTLIKHDSQKATVNNFYIYYFNNVLSADQYKATTRNALLSVGKEYMKDSRLHPNGIPLDAYLKAVFGIIHAQRNNLKISGITKVGDQAFDKDFMEKFIEASEKPFAFEFDTDVFDMIQKGEITREKLLADAGYEENDTVPFYVERIISNILKKQELAKKFDIEQVGEFKETNTIDTMKLIIEHNLINKDNPEEATMLKSLIQSYMKLLKTNGIKLSQEEIIQDVISTFDEYTLKMITDSKYLLDENGKVIPSSIKPKLHIAAIDINITKKLYELLLAKRGEQIPKGLVYIDTENILYKRNKNIYEISWITADGETKQRFVKGANILDFNTMSFLEKNNYSQEEIRTLQQLINQHGQSIGEIYQELLNDLKGNKIVGHNVTYDIKQLKEHFQQFFDGLAVSLSKEIEQLGSDEFKRLNQMTYTELKNSVEGQKFDEYSDLKMVQQLLDGKFKDELHLIALPGVTKNGRYLDTQEYELYRNVIQIIKDGFIKEDKTEAFNLLKKYFMSSFTEQQFNDFVVRYTIKLNQLMQQDSLVTIGKLGNFVDGKFEIDDNTSIKISKEENATYFRMVAEQEAFTSILYDTAKGNGDGLLNKIIFNHKSKDFSYEDLRKTFKFQNSIQTEFENEDGIMIGENVNKENLKRFIEQNDNNVLNELVNNGAISQEEFKFLIQKRKEYHESIAKNGENFNVEAGEIYQAIYSRIVTAAYNISFEHLMTNEDLESAQKVDSIIKDNPLAFYKMDDEHLEFLQEKIDRIYGKNGDLLKDFKAHITQSTEQRKKYQADLDSIKDLIIHSMNKTTTAIVRNISLNPFFNQFSEQELFNFVKDVKRTLNEMKTNGIYFDNDEAKFDNPQHQKLIKFNEHNFKNQMLFNQLAFNHIFFAKNSKMANQLLINWYGYDSINGKSVSNVDRNQSPIENIYTPYIKEISQNSELAEIVRNTLDDLQEKSKHLRGFYELGEIGKDFKTVKDEFENEIVKIFEDYMDQLFDKGSGTQFKNYLTTLLDKNNQQRFNEIAIKIRDAILTKIQYKNNGFKRFNVNIKPIEKWLKKLIESYESKINLTEYEFNTDIAKWIEVNNEVVPEFNKIKKENKTNKNKSFSDYNDIEKEQAKSWFNSVFKNALYETKEDFNILMDEFKIFDQTNAVISYNSYSQNKIKYGDTWRSGVENSFQKELEIKNSTENEYMGSYYHKMHSLTKYQKNIIEFGKTFFPSKENPYGIDFEKLLEYLNKGDGKRLYTFTMVVNPLENEFKELSEKEIKIFKKNNPNVKIVPKYKSELRRINYPTHTDDSGIRTIVESDSIYNFSPSLKVVEIKTAEQLEELVELHQTTGVLFGITNKYDLLKTDNISYGEVWLNPVERFMRNLLVLPQKVISLMTHGFLGRNAVANMWLNYQKILGGTRKDYIDFGKEYGFAHKIHFLHEDAKRKALQNRIDLLSMFFEIDPNDKEHLFDKINKVDFESIENKDKFDTQINNWIANINANIDAFKKYNKTKLQDGDKINFEKLEKLKNNLLYIQNKYNSIFQGEEAKYLSPEQRRQNKVSAYKELIVEVSKLGFIGEYFLSNNNFSENNFGDLVQHLMFANEFINAGGMSDIFNSDVSFDEFKLNMNDLIYDPTMEKKSYVDFSYHNVNSFMSKVYGIESGILNWWTEGGKIGKKGKIEINYIGKATNYLERVARLHGAFLEYFHLGKSKNDAFTRGLETFFNYGRKSYEEQMHSLAFPFISFFTRNFDYYLNMFDNPKYQRIMSNIMQGMIVNDEDEQQNKKFFDFMGMQNWIPFSDNWGMKVGSADFDAAAILEDPIEATMQKANPIAKIALDAIGGNTDTASLAKQSVIGGHVDRATNIVTKVITGKVDSPADIVPSLFFEYRNYTPYVYRYNAIDTRNIYKDLFFADGTRRTPSKNTLTRIRQEQWKQKQRAMLNKRRTW